MTKPKTQTLWTIKVFRSVEAMKRWVKANDGRMQWHELFVHNGWAVEYRSLRVIEFNDQA